MKLAPLALALLAPSLSAADDAGDAPRPEKPPVLYADRSWTHIGDGNFSPQSNGFSDLTTKSAGPALEFEVTLTKEQWTTVANDRWKSAVLTGSVIGNDTGQFGETTPTRVQLDGKEIGRITKSGLFRIVIDKARLLAGDPEKPLRFRIASGKNSGDDVDDQELGSFRLVLSKDVPPKPPSEDESADDEPKPPSDEE